MQPAPLVLFLATLACGQERISLSKPRAELKKIDTAVSALTAKYTSRRRCSNCDGRGYHIQKTHRTKREGGWKETKTKTHKNRCRICDGKGSVVVENRAAYQDSDLREALMFRQQLSQMTSAGFPVLRECAINAPKLYEDFQEKEIDPVRKKTDDLINLLLRFLVELTPSILQEDNACGRLVAFQSTVTAVSEIQGERFAQMRVGEINVFVSIPSGVHWVGGSEKFILANVDEAKHYVTVLGSGQSGYLLYPLRWD